MRSPAELILSFHPNYGQLLLKCHIKFNYVVYFHKNAPLTSHLHDFDNLRTFVAKFCRSNLRTFSANSLGLKNSYRQLIRFLDVWTIMMLMMLVDDDVDDDDQLESEACFPSSAPPPTQGWAGHTDTEPDK